MDGRPDYIIMGKIIASTDTLCQQCARHFEGHDCAYPDCARFLYELNSSFAARRIGAYFRRKGKKVKVEY